MQLDLKIAVPIALTGGLLTGWLAGIVATPHLVTDTMFERFMSNGAELNTLSRAPLRTAKTAKVVADNADTLTRSAIIDLSEGPLLLDVDLPTTAAYWSVSLFAHNTDTFYVANDQTITSSEPGRFRLAIRREDQSVPDDVSDAVATSPSRYSFLIIRATMPDRSHADAVTFLQQEVMQSRVEPLRIDE